MSSGWLMFIVAAAIVASIMIHEWGHLITARRFGMRADRFFLGFGPTLWSTRRGETEYGVKLFWIGGFVRIKGMSPTDRRLRPVVDAVFDPEVVADDRRAVAKDEPGALATIPAVPRPTWDRLDAELRRRGTPADLRKRMLHRAQLNVGEDATPAEARRMVTEIISSEVADNGRVGDLRHRLLKGDEGRFFGDRPAWQRAIVLASGAAMHFVQAFILLFVGLLLFGQSTVEPEVAGVVPDTPASAAGFQAGDVILQADGAEIDGFESFREVVRSHPGEELTVTVQRGERQRTLTVVPEATEDQESGETVGFVGIEPEVTFGRLPASDALYETFVGDFSVPNQVRLTFTTLGRVFGPEGLGAIFSQVAGEQDRSAEGAMSLVGVARVAPSGTDAVGPVFIFLILASVNVFVGVFNVLPLPPLDGGHLLVLGIESTVNAVRRRSGQPADYKVDPRTFAAVALPVILVLGTLSLALVWLDVVNPISLTP